MLRISGSTEKEEEICAAFVYHPDSSALETRVREITHEELEKFGMDVKDAHQIHNDLDFVRDLRKSRRMMVSIVMKVLIVGLLSLLGSLVLAGINPFLGGKN